jgi:hypothetical protein
VCANCCVWMYTTTEISRLKRTTIPKSFFAHEQSATSRKELADFSIATNTFLHSVLPLRLLIMAILQGMGECIIYQSGN